MDACRMKAGSAAPGRRGLAQPRRQTQGRAPTGHPAWGRSSARPRRAPGGRRPSWSGCAGPCSAAAPLSEPGLLHAVYARREWLAACWPPCQASWACVQCHCSAQHLEANAAPQALCARAGADSCCNVACCASSPRRSSAVAGGEPETACHGKRCAIRATQTSTGAALRRGRAATWVCPGRP